MYSFIHSKREKLLKFEGKFEGKFERKNRFFKKKLGQRKVDLSLQILRFQFELKEHIYGFKMKILLFNDNKIK